MELRSRFGFFFVLLMILFFASPEYVWAQNYEQIRLQLRQEQNKRRTEIEDLKKQLLYYEDKVSESDQKFEQLNRDLIRLEKEILIRKQVIDKLTDESQSIQKEIQLTQGEYKQKEDELNMLIAQYKQVLIYLYKHGRTSELAMILAAENMSQMLSRSFYLKKFSEHRQKQANDIKGKQTELVEKQKELEAARNKNSAVLAEQNKERVTLDEKRKKQDKLLIALQKDRRKLKQLFITTQKDLENLSSVLDNLIAEEIRVRLAEEERVKKLEEERVRRLAEAQNIVDANKRKEEIAKYEKPIVSSKIVAVTDKQIAQMETTFTKLKGQLPWPVENGVISAKFGNIVHPIYKTKVSNNGIEITTEPKASVYAIHDGVVTSVLPITGYGDVIIINHGKYNSVYGNLSQVFVRKDMVVKAGDLIAKGGDNHTPKENVVLLIIKQDKEYQNPEKWIVKK